MIGFGFGSDGTGGNWTGSISRVSERNTHRLTLSTCVSPSTIPAHHQQTLHSPQRSSTPPADLHRNFTF
ncbi:hypothetical protein BU26DRAFT_41689 [Trematosphaeria pertusa]|uniref:Uncharacterized protein n=1 Tax=Trematosphaeria pertusa TaxID=390896 RepID=A0A6A6J3V8_9PLEO|nr:uncharacterized protein BU26DRAFT_41689 [Trematosphaeria pertusa]KAF2257326.1 hypothetical protein BU26DRAFT_41689 [Trematosphaeria pertusa]